MLDEKFKDLIEREIDGETSAQESEMVRKRLARDPEAFSYHGRLSALSASLKRVTPIEPDPDLKAGILRSIRALDRKHEPVSVRSSSLGERLATFLEGVRFLFRLPAARVFAGLGVAAGLALAFFMLQGSPTVPRDVRGTMGGAATPQHESGSIDSNDLLNSAIVRDLIQDQTFRKAALDPAFESLMADDAVRESFFEAVVHGSPIPGGWLSASTTVTSLTTDRAFRSALESEEFRNAMQYNKFRVSLLEAARQAGKN